MLLPRNFLGFLAVAWAFSGCAQSPPADFGSPEPAARNAAIVQAAATRNERAVPDLINMLESDDPATRLLAIGTLERLTGRTLGYDYAAGEPARRAGVDAWRAWERERRGPPAPPKQ